MGAMMRERFSIPCALSETLVADGAPKVIRLMGRGYVAFRATDDGRAPAELPTTVRPIDAVEPVDQPWRELAYPKRRQIRAGQQGSAR